MNIYSILQLCGGLAFFLFGMHVMSGSLEKLAGGNLQKILKEVTSNPIKSLFFGAIVTIAIQSSSALTVMLVGLVNSGIMELAQTVGVIMGSNIGTTLTAWILSLSGIESDNLFISMLKPENFSPVIALIGVIMIMGSKKEKHKDVGIIMAGFAVLMYGMQLMSGAVSPLADMPEFTGLLTTFNNPFLGVLVGAVFTGVIQSSAASVGVLQALAMTGAISYSMAIPIIMGQNIGTCVTALLSSVGANKNARRAARVEVALVSVDIPDREPVSRIRLDLKNETAERLKENPEFAALVSSDPITAAIERYNAAAEGVRRIYEEYNGIKSLFSSAGAGKKENPVMAFTKSYNDAIRELRGMYWKQLFEMPQLFDAMTYEMQQDYQKRIKELEGYDFSAYNILTVREEISRNLLSSIDHEIIKLFDDWTNLHYNDEYSKNVHYYNGWCTNSAYKINRKVIFRCNAFDTYDGRFCPRYNATGHVAQIERVLHFLDTNGKPYNGDELRAVLDAAEKSGQTQKIQLHYFTATFYKKGTCHIEFTNTDVLKSFNLYAGQRKGWLPPTYGKKSYHDMAAADRRVVDSYEGEASYTDTLTRHLIPTQSTFLQLNA